MAHESLYGNWMGKSRLMGRKGPHKGRGRGVGQVAGTQEEGCGVAWQGEPAELTSQAGLGLVSSGMRNLPWGWQDWLDAPQWHLGALWGLSP